MSLFYLKNGLCAHVEILYSYSNANESSSFTTYSIYDSKPSWIDSAKAHGALITDPPLSPLGHRQAMETADHLWKLVKESKERHSTTNNEDTANASVTAGIHRYHHHVDEILVSPYLRVIQTAIPTSTLLGLPLSIESGLSESHATPGPNILPTPSERFRYFPQINPNYTSLLEVKSTPGYRCSKTGYPCEAFAGRYIQRMQSFASILEKAHYGKSIVLFSHAASVALVASLLRCSMRQLKFAPCGIYQLQRVNDNPWTLVRNGECNAEYVSENSATTYPWGFSDEHFQEDGNGISQDGGAKRNEYFGSSEGIDLDYFAKQRDDE